MPGVTSGLKAYAEARLESLIATQHIEQQADLLITMMWNTDQTDVDLHVIEPSGKRYDFPGPTRVTILRA